MCLDWYDYMKLYEDAHGSRYLIDVQNCYICIYRARDSTLLGRFTREQAAAFFYGLLYSHVPKDVDELNNAIDYWGDVFYGLNYDYLPEDDVMPLQEEYCYMYGYYKLYVER